MKTQLLGIALFTLTLAAVAVYPSINAPQPHSDPEVAKTHQLASTPIIDVVFVLDTTGSMSGLIQTAKDKIWSIATTMTSAQQTPNIRIGLVGFRDRGDEYVTRVIDLSDDLDSVYASLMEFQADGGGDGPESVNKALYDAVHGISWSQDPRAYQVVFLVGDAPPHMDYPNELRYPEIIAMANRKGIVVNTIQCGDVASTLASWQRIAGLGNGRFFQVEQAGSAVAVASPFDAEIAALSEKMDGTRLYYGSAEEKAKMQSKVEATEKLNKQASIASRARRGAFNASAGGKKNLLGENELVDAVASGRVDLDAIDKEALPAALKPLAPEEQKAMIAQMAGERRELARQVHELAQKRDRYIAGKIDADGGADDSLDHKLYDAVREQASKAGLEYSDGPSY
jgi:Mg-chelatase subunit ChlD